ncbi:hypothetical protein [Vibrio sp. V24_P1S3T111]|uniref:hypothetical protein n=1 Tax=Vibrio sp. V24_P1S3T111 TaxID=1938676 RepID=UPI00192A0113
MAGVRIIDVLCANKRFKRDSQRVAFLLCVSFSGYGVVRKVSSSVGCPLSGRYEFLAKVVLMNVNELVDAYTLDISETIKTEFSAKYQYDILLDHFSSFQNYSEAVSDKNSQVSALLMVNYLATWGMYRGSGNLRHTNTFFMEFILHCILNRDNGYLCALYHKSFNEFSDEDELALDTLLNNVRSCIRTGGVTPTDTLVSKILLGVWGQVPAYDRYFVSGLKTINKEYGFSIPTSLSGRALIKLAQWAKHYKWNSVSTSYDFVESIQYPSGKVVDMAIFQLGKNS